VLSTWVFGYGSLVSPISLGATIDRAVDLADGGWSEATIGGWGRRWNYGVGHWYGVHRDPGGAELSVTIVALGLAAAADETTNGVVVRVDDEELARLDRRERDYDRVDVTEAVEAPVPLDGRVVTYVPRPSAVERYESARDSGRAAIEQRYWDLVEGAFAALGTDRLDRYRRTTPAPDVPVLVLDRRS
jgi:cation transport regulator ChaC